MVWLELICAVLLATCLACGWQVSRIRMVLPAMEVDRRQQREGRIKSLRLLKQTRTRIEVLESCSSSAAATEDRQRRSPSLQLPDGELIRPVGYIDGVWPRRNGTPRQACLVPSSRASVVFYDDEQDVAELAGFSHVWIVFLFHFNTNLHRQDRVKPRIRPPRLGGRRKIGMYATRTPHRPNNVGISLCRLRSVDAGGALRLSGIDLVSGTPVLQILPYLHSQHDVAHSRVPVWLDEALQRRAVVFSAQADIVLAHHWREADGVRPPKSHYTSAEQVRQFLLETLSYDIRGYRQKVAEEHAHGTPTYKVYLDVLEVLWLMPDAQQTTVLIQSLHVIDPLDIPYPVDEDE